MSVEPSSSGKSVEPGQTKPKHKRSRKGCLPCRTRRVKCDERKPICCNSLSHPPRKPEPQPEPKIVAPPGKSAAPSKKRKVESTSPTPGPTLSYPASPELANHPVNNPPIVHAVAKQEHSPTFYAQPQQGVQNTESFQDWLAPFSDIQPDPGMSAFSDLGFTAPFYDQSLQGLISEDVYWDHNSFFGAANHGTTAPTVPSANPILLPIAQPSHASSSTSVSATATDEQYDENRLVKHFLETLSVWAVMRDNAAPNYYHSIYNKSLSDNTLFRSLLAVSAMHLARSRSDGDAEKLKKEAQSRFAAIQPILQSAARSHVPHSAKDAESLISSILLTAEFEILKGASHQSISDQIEIATAVLSNLACPLSDLSPSTQRVCVILSSVDTRMALFGVHKGAFVEVLGSHVFDDALQIQPEQTALSAPYLQLLRSNVLMTRVAQLDREIRLGAWQRDHPLRQELEHRVLSLEAGLQGLSAILDPLPLVDQPTAFFVAQDVGPDELNFLYVTSVANAALIYLYRVADRLGLTCSPHPAYRSPSKAAQRIILANLKAQNEHSNGLKALWPRSLFFAGIETDDPIYLDWILKSMSGPTNASAALTSKSRKLLGEIRKIESTTGRTCDILEVMQRVTGLFVM